MSPATYASMSAPDTPWLTPKVSCVNASVSTERKSATFASSPATSAARGVSMVAPMSKSMIAPR